MTTTVAPTAPDTCPFGTGDPFTIRIVKDVKTRAGNVLITAGTVTVAWTTADAGDPRYGIPTDSVTAWTPSHYAGIEWSTIRRSAWRHA